jgi:hypothetical protein
MKRNKYADKAGLIAEMLTLGGEPLAKAVHDIIEEVIRSRQVPTAWKVTIMKFLPKKGDPSKPENYRGITYY